MRRRRLAPVAVELRELALAPADDGLRTVEPPPVAGAGVAVAPGVDTATLPLDGEPIDVLGVELAPPVDVVPVRLVGSLFAERRRDVRFDPPRLEAMPLVDAAIESPPAQPGPAEVVVQHPDRLARMFRRATPLDGLPPEHVRECVTRLYRQSGLRSPAELTLVGIFERVPGGVVHAVSPQPSGVVLRLDYRGTPRPATLVVGKRRRDGALLTVEVEPLAGA
jgi:hypothetical protein